MRAGAPAVIKDTPLKGQSGALAGNRSPLNFDTVYKKRGPHGRRGSTSFALDLSSRLETPDDLAPGSGVVSAGTRTLATHLMTYTFAKGTKVALWAQIQFLCP